jgi:hypothetical protein
MSQSRFGQPPAFAETGEEAIETGGRTFKTRWHKSKASNEAGEVFVTTWTSDEVPGGLVKSITRTPGIGKTTTTVLVQVVLSD